MNILNEPINAEHELQELEYFCSTQLDEYSADDADILELVQLGVLSVER